MRGIAHLALTVRGSTAVVWARGEWREAKRHRCYRVGTARRRSSGVFRGAVVETADGQAATSR